MLETMAAFFDARLEGYDNHMLHGIEGAELFYPFTAHCLPSGRILDLGCGTGLELQWYFAKNPTASVTGIDLAPGMLEAVKSKFPDRDLTLLQGSYFDLPFGEAQFDAAVSVESLHHFTMGQKIPLYRKLHAALKEGGWFILTDYFAATEEEERRFRQELTQLKASCGIGDAVSCHYDTPLTVDNEICALMQAGFRTVDRLNSWGATHTLRAWK